MDLKELSQRAIEIRNKYSQLEKKKIGRPWTNAEIAQGFVGDVGDLVKLIMAKSGIREIENADERLSHELADCFWCILVLAKRYDVDLEKEFLDTMDILEKRIALEDRE